MPIHKIGNKDKLSNYRPVSVLPALSKVYERLVFNRLVHYLDKNEILHDQQFGFRRGYSTSMAIHALADQFYESAENNEFMLGLFIDLSRAFDTISHKILLDKLKHYGIRGIAWGWISDYLSNRKQFVTYNQCKSEMNNVNIGVPQGSILGPLLFLLYVNDLPTISSHLNFIQFADDTSIFIKGKSILDISRTMSSEMRNVTEWLKNNKLTLNLSKTNFMVMTTQGKRFNDDECNIIVDNVIIERVTNCKFLGVVLDDKFTWKLHIDHIKNKVSKGLGILLKSRKILDRESLVTLYNALIKPYFTYGLTIWGNTFKSYLKRLEIVQKKIMSVITFSDYYAHTTPLFCELKIMTITQLYEYFSCIHIYRCMKCIVPRLFWGDFILSKTKRNPLNLQPKFYSKKICTTSIRHGGVKICNKLPKVLQNAKSIQSFKYKLRKYILTS